MLVDTDDGRGVKTLRTTYATKSNAMRAARSEYKRLLRGSVTPLYVPLLVMKNSQKSIINSYRHMATK